MSFRIVRFAALLAVPCAALAFGNAWAGTKKPVDIKQICQKKVMEKIKAKDPGAKDIQLTTSREWQESSTQSGIGGTGTLKAANKKMATRDFEWTCTYDTAKNKLVDVHVDKMKQPAK